MKALPMREIAELYTQGASLKELANKYGVSVPTISRRLKKAGINVRPKGRRARNSNITASQPATSQSVSDEAVATATLPESSDEEVQEIMVEQATISVEADEFENFKRRIVGG